MYCHNMKDGSFCAAHLINLHGKEHSSTHIIHTWTRKKTLDRVPFKRLLWELKTTWDAGKVD